MNAKTQVQELAKSVKSLPIANASKDAKDAENLKKAELLKTIEQFKPEPFKSAEERILRKNEFSALANRYEQLKLKENELKMFHAGNDKMNAKIVFKNAQGFEFEIQNSNVISKLTNAAQTELKILLEESKNEVLTFEI